MKEFYEKSLQEIRDIGGVLSRKRNELAMEKNLLSTESLKYISGMEFEELCLQVLKEACYQANRNKLLT